MRKLTKVEVSIAFSGEGCAIHRAAVMTEREISSLTNKITDHTKKCNNMRKAEAHELKERLAELEA